MVFYDGNWIGVVNDVVDYEELAENEVCIYYVYSALNIYQIVANKFGCSSFDVSMLSNCTQCIFGL